MLSGCWSHTKALGPRSDAAGTSPQSQQGVLWPARDEDVVRMVSLGTPSRIPRFLLRPNADENALTPEERVQLASVSHIVHYSGHHALGALRLFDVVEPPGARRRGSAPTESDLRNMFGFLPNGTFITSRGLLHPDQLVSMEFESRLQLMLDEMDQMRSTRDARGEGLLVRFRGRAALGIDSGMRVRCPLPGTIFDEARVRGIVVHLAALAGNPFEPRVIDALERDGWIVLSLDTAAGIDAPRNRALRREFVARLEELRSISARKAELPSGPGMSARHSEYQELSRRETRLLSEIRAIERSGDWRAYDASEGVDPVELGRTIASEVDDTLASNAFAAQAVVEYAHQQFPFLRTKPVVLVGFSAGALATPTAALRLREQGVEPAAMVLVGGGADLFDIAQTSSLTDGGIRLRMMSKRGSAKPPDEFVKRVHEVYQQTTHLDPVSTAPRVRDIPALMLHASWDTWVPAHSGDRLYELLGRPERWTLLGGHGMLFYFLPGQRGAIARWVRERVSFSDEN